MSYDADLKLFIDGNWSSGEGRDTHNVINPATGSGIADLPLGHQGRHRRSARRRRPRLADLARDRGREARRDPPQDRRPAPRTRRPYRRDHDPGAGQAARRSRARSARLGVAVRPGMPRRSSATTAALWSARPASCRGVIRQPVGPTATFTPWNFPIYLLAKKVAAALAAGCTVISRPPQETPGCTGELFRALADAGIPAGVAQLVHGKASMVSTTLLDSPIIRKVSFTGSVPVGKQLMHLAADSMTRITLELGGHAPVLIFDDCDLEKTLDMVVPQKFRNAGQVCVSPTRFYVQESIYDAFLKGFAERTAEGEGRRRPRGRHQDGPARQCPPPRSGRRLDRRRPRQRARASSPAASRATAASSSSRPCSPTSPTSAEIMNEEPFGPVAVTARVQGLRRSDRAGQPPALRPRRLRLHRKRPPRQSARRRDRKRHGRHQHLRHLDRRRAVRRGQGFRLRQRRRQGRAGDLPGRQGDPPGVIDHLHGLKRGCDAHLADAWQRCPALGPVLLLVEHSAPGWLSARLDRVIACRLRARRQC